MINTNVTNFRKQIFELIDQTVKYNEPINISTKSGNAVLISEEDYNNLVETMYLNSIPGFVFLSVCLPFIFDFRLLLIIASKA